MTLTNEDIKLLQRLNYSKKVKLSFGEYWVKKPTTNLDAINELIMQEVVKEFGLLSPIYYLVNINGEMYVLSTDLNALGNFKTAEELEIYDENIVSIYEIENKLQTKLGNCSDLIFDVMKMFMMDMLFYNTDRVASNWGILFKENNERQVGVIDNEMILDIENVMVINSYLDTLEYKSKIKELSHIELFQTNLENFLNNLEPNLLLETFAYYYQKMHPEHFKELLDKIKNSKVLTIDGYVPLDNPYEDELLELYSENYEIIKEVWENLKNGRK